MGNTNTYAAFRSLTREWERLAVTATAERTLAAWAETEPALAELSSLIELRDRGSDALLRALLRLGDDFARRAFLQAMLPGLVGVARLGTARQWVGPGRVWRSTCELNAELLELTWVWIDRHAGAPPDWPASTLVTHLAHAVAYRARKDRRDRSRLRSLELVDHERPGDLSAERTGIDAAMRLVCDAVDAGVLPLTYAQVLYAIRIRRDGYRMCSERTGRSVNALKQVCRRAEAKLARLADEAA